VCSGGLTARGRGGEFASLTLLEKLNIFGAGTYK
jgi:hypothetical protein